MSTLPHDSAKSGLSLPARGHPAGARNFGYTFVAPPLDMNGQIERRISGRSTRMPAAWFASAPQGERGGPSGAPARRKWAFRYDISGGDDDELATASMRSGSSSANMCR